MVRKLLAGTFSAVPVRVHVYGSRGVLMPMDANGTGCWSDPDGNVLLHSVEDAEALLDAHGYVLDRETMAVTPKPEEQPWTPPEGFVLQAPFPGQDPELAIFLHEDGRRIFVNPARDGFAPLMFAPLPEGFEVVTDDTAPLRDVRVDDAVDENESGVLILFVHPDDRKVLLFYDGTTVELPARSTSEDQSESDPVTTDADGDDTLAGALADLGFTGAESTDTPKVAVWPVPGTSNAVGAISAEKPPVSPPAQPTRPRRRR